MTMAAGLGALEDEAYFKANCRVIMDNRAWTTRELSALGFTTLESWTNFVFTKTDAIPGKLLYAKLKEKGILIRHFDTPRLTDYIRVSIGNREQMEAFIATVKTILEETP
jgi:histidinol-phosphate aminotransferase